MNCGWQGELSKRRKPLLLARLAASLCSAGTARGQSDDISVGLKAFQEGLFERAVRAYQRKARFDPGNLAAWVYLGEALRRLDRSAEAQATYERALTIDPRCGRCATAFGTFLQNRGQVEAARRRCERAARLLPDNDQVSAYRGDCCLRLDRVDDARDCYEMALQIDPLLVEALSEMVCVSIFSNDMTGARRRLELLIKMAPDLANSLEPLISL